MRRREFIFGAGCAAAWPLAGRAQTRRPLVALVSSAGGAFARRWTASGFLEGMRERGHVVGRDFAFVERYAENDPAAVPRIAREVADLSPGIVVVNIVTVAREVGKLMPSVPIVLAQSFDPVANGLIASYARPGGNITGVTSGLLGQTAKLVEIARDTLGAARRFGALNDPREGAAGLYAKEMREAAAALGLEIDIVDVVDVADIEAALARFASARMDGVVLPTPPLFYIEAPLLARLALAARLPTFAPAREHVEAGCLMSYGVNRLENYRRAAYFVDRLLKGAKPADLPVEFPTRVELVLNMGTAKAIGIEIPQVMQLRADEVIE